MPGRRLLLEYRFVVGGVLGLGFWSFLGAWALMMAATMLATLASLTGTYLASPRIGL